MNKIYTLKIESVYYERLVGQAKTYEIRLNDRDFQVNDILMLKRRPTSGEPYSEIVEPCKFVITHVLNSFQFPDGLKEGYCILSLKQVEDE